MAFTLRLSDEQGQTLRAIIGNAQRGRADFEYLVSLGGEDYTPEDIETTRAQNAAQVKLETILSAVLSVQDGPDVSPDPVAVATFQHNHAPSDHGRFVRENCGACALFGVAEFSEDGRPLEPNRAGWTRLYVQAHAPVPERYRAAFYAALSDDNDSYARALAGDVARHGVRFA